MTKYTLSNSISNGIILTATGAYGSPFTILSTGTIHPSSGNAISSPITNASVLNFGVIEGEVQFTKGGEVTNSGSKAHISGDVIIGGTSGNGTVINSGFIYGAYLQPGGLITNAAKAQLGFAAFRGTGTLLNSGTIYGSSFESVQLDAGGTISNSQPTSVVYSENIGIEVGAASSITNYGTIDGLNWAIRDEEGTSLQIRNMGTASLIQGGRSDAFFRSSAIYSDGNTRVNVVNEGHIKSGLVAFFAENYLYLNNLGTAALVSGVSYTIFSGQTVIKNQGTITGTGIGIRMATGSITNIGSSSTIYGFDGGIQMGSGTVSNAGAIASPLGYGVSVSGSATITNFGTISGGSGAIDFNSAGNDRLIIDPGAFFYGLITAKGTSNTVELASGKGTLSSFNSQFSGFSSLTLDAGAVWDISGTTTFGNTLTITNNGTIAEGHGDVLTVDAPVLDAGLFKMGKDGIAFNNVVSSDQKIEFSGTGETLTLGDAQAFKGKVEKFEKGDIIALAGVSLGSIEGTYFSNGVLTLTEIGGPIKLAFANPKSFAGYSFAAFSDTTGTGVELTKAIAAVPAIARIDYGMESSSTKTHYLIQASDPKLGVSQNGLLRGYSGWMREGTSWSTLTTPSSPVTFSTS